MVRSMYLGLKAGGWRRFVYDLEPLEDVGLKIWRSFNTGFPLAGDPGIDILIDLLQGNEPGIQQAPRVH
jgi:hypothetical protein